ncbi:hypothetical protein NRU17_004315 [Salmonella enterica]|nr:hypothetical protein [Salmonella enterica]
MATLKDHQQAMVDLLASGSGIPASASRLAHAVHDVLSAKLREKQTDVIGEVHKWSIDRCLAGRANYTDMQNLIIDAYVSFEPEQAGCRKPDTQVCEHEWLQDISSSYAECRKCGDVQK